MQRISNDMNCTWPKPEVNNSNPYEIGNYCELTISPSNNLIVDNEGLYQVPTGIIVLLSIFYGSISVIAVIGNSLVIWIIAISRRMHNVTHYFIANLALADIVIGLFSIPFQFQAALLQKWNLPHFMCPFCPFVQILSVNVSIFTLTAIAVDRHRAVLNPLSGKPSKLRAKITISGVWSLGAILAVPMVIALRVTNVVEADLIGKIHSRPFCQNVHFSDSTMMCYRFVLFLVQYAMPLCIITWAYSRMAHRLWMSKAPGNAEDARDATIMRNKKKVIKMLVIVVVLFALCWLPLQTYNVLQDVFPQINKYRYINIVWFCFDWLAMSNSCYNPFIYGIYNEKFKREFQIRFPGFQSRHWSSAYNSDSIDLDRTKQSLLHTGISIRWSQNNITNEFRRYSNSNIWKNNDLNFSEQNERSNRNSMKRFDQSGKLRKHSKEKKFVDLRHDYKVECSANSGGYVKVSTVDYTPSPSPRAKIRTRTE